MEDLEYVIGAYLLDWTIHWRRECWDHLQPKRLIMSEDNRKIKSSEDNAFVADFALDKFSWQLTLWNPSIGATSLSIIVESVPESKRTVTVTVRLSLEILTAITCERVLSWCLIWLMTVFITASEGAWLFVDVAWSWCKRLCCYLFHILHLTVDLQSLVWWPFDKQFQ